MQNLYTRLTELLGKSEEHPDFSRFIHDLGEKPKLNAKKSVSFYDFQKNGIEVLAQDNDSKGKILWAAIFFVDAAGGSMKPYCGEFLAIHNRC
jgi:hypothetical protein